MRKMLTRFRRLFGGDVDCPQCGTWFTRRERDKLGFFGPKYWACSGCKALLSLGAMIVVLRRLALLVIILSGLPVLILAAFVGERFGSVPIGGIAAGTFLLLLVLVCVSAPPTFLSLTQQSGARIMFRQGVCRRCGYDLRGACHERCPECGTPCLEIVQAWRTRQARLTVAGSGTPPLLEPLAAPAGGAPPVADSHPNA